jgi:hypothetical protein
MRKNEGAFTPYYGIIIKVLMFSSSLFLIPIIILKSAAAAVVTPSMERSNKE